MDRWWNASLLTRVSVRTAVANRQAGTTGTERVGTGRTDCGRLHTAAQERPRPRLVLIGGSAFADRFATATVATDREESGRTLVTVGADGAGSVVRR